jgi:uncharacterized protein (TIGR00255 family)
MLKSMTGYGIGSVSNDDHEISVEIKTLNSKFADVFIRIPSQWTALELAIRKQLIDRLVRGKISISIEVSSKTSDDSTLFDEVLLNRYYYQFKDASDKLNESSVDLFSLALHAPGVLKLNEDSIEEDVSASITKAVVSAIDKCDEFRSKEGEELRLKLDSYINTISSLSGDIDPFDKERIIKIEEKMKAGLAKSSTASDSDNNRFEQELIYYIEKLDISEEKVRLATHLAHFTEVLEAETANGKKLGFIAQELGREINTIGSKANDSSIQRIVVEMKEELEKIKEQVLNVL